MEIGSALSSGTAAALKAAQSEGNPETGVKLIKKSLQAEKDFVTELLPPQGLVDIRA